MTEYIEKLLKMFSDEAIEQAKEIADILDETKLIEKIEEFLYIISEKKDSGLVV